MNFNNSLKKGALGETLLLNTFSNITKLDGRRGDLATYNGQKLELKTDFYKHKPDGNFFIERYSSLESKSPGGPWQADAHGCKLFAYLFYNSKLLYVWKTQDLIWQVEDLEPGLINCKIKNKSWTTLGYKVPIKLLTDYDLIAIAHTQVMLEAGDGKLFESLMGDGL